MALAPHADPGRECTPPDFPDDGQMATENSDRRTAIGACSNGRYRTGYADPMKAENPEEIIQPLSAPDGIIVHTGLKDFFIIAKPIYFVKR